MTSSNDLMRHLLSNLPEGEREHIVEIVDLNHAEQLQRKRQSGSPDPISTEEPASVETS